MSHIFNYNILLPRYSAFSRRPQVFENLYDPLPQKPQMSTGHHCQTIALVPSEICFNYSIIITK